MQVTSLMTLEQRLYQLEALEQIRQLKYRYLNACDLKQVEVIRDCFAPGPIRIDYGDLGVFHDRDDFLALYTRLACQPEVIDLHHGSNPELVLESATEARGRWALFYFNLNPQTGITRQLGGFYEDRYRLTEAGWRIVATCSCIHSVVNGLSLDGESTQR